MRFISTIGNRAARQGSVLIVTETERRELAAPLERAGIAVKCAAPARLAQLVENEAPDVVIVDSSEGLRACRDVDRGAHLRVIAIVDGVDARLQAVRAGADHVVAPGAVDEIVARVPWLIAQSVRDRAMAVKVDTVRLWHDWVRYLVHDLRNPITVAGAYATLARQSESPADLNESLALVSSSLDEITRMLQDILDTDRIQHGALKPQFEEVDVVELARDVAERLQTTHAVDVRAHGDTRIQADPVLLRRVFANLMGNAARHATQKPVAVEVSGGPHGISASISNDGPAIPAELLPHLFEPWQPIAARTNGTGLGLAFCRLVCEAHAGRIWLESSAAGAVTFAFGIPRSAPASAEHA